MKFVHRTSVSFPDLRLFTTFGWAIVGVIMSQKPHFSHWQPFRTENTQASSKERQFSRWLHNDRIQPAKIYPHIVKAMLKDWADQKIYLALDTSMLWNRFVIIRVSLIYCGRAIPLKWVVCAGKSATVPLAKYQRLLAQVAELIPSSCRVTFLADRAFGDVNLLKILKQIGWHFRIRLKSNYWIFQASHQARQVSSLMPTYGNGCFINHVWITKRQYGPLYLALGHVITPNGHEKWAIISDEPAGRHTFDEYGLRFCIEENFLDDKSAGFNLEDSGLEDSESISRLCLIIATATVYLVSTGKAIDDLGLRKSVDTHWFRGLSYLQIGWRWCKRAVFNQKWLLDFIWIPPDPDPEPSIASWSQFHQPMYELHAIEFL
jgi:hypothetical protein